MTIHGSLISSMSEQEDNAIAVRKIKILFITQFVSASKLAISAISKQKDSDLWAREPQLKTETSQRFRFFPRVEKIGGDTERYN